MKKIKLMQNAATFISDLKVDEIKLLQKQNPMALALVEPNTTGGEDIIFTVQYKNAAFGDISDTRITFVDQDSEGCACLTVLLPANSKNKTTYLYEKYSAALALLKVVERNAKRALTNLTDSKEAFVKELINLDNDITVSEALEDADIIIKATQEEENN